MEDVIKLWCAIMCTFALITIAITLGHIAENTSIQHKCDIKLEQKEK